MTLEAIQRYDVWHLKQPDVLDTLEYARIQTEQTRRDHCALKEGSQATYRGAKVSKAAAPGAGSATPSSCPSGCVPPHAGVIDTCSDCH